MPTFQSILCPIDFSDTSVRALRYAFALASTDGARLDVLYVAPVLADDVTPSGPVPYCIPKDEIRERMRRALDAVTFTAVTTDLAVEQGAVHRAIVQRAAARGADLLVIGTHGRGGFSHLFLGSVAEKVVREAVCPVLTVPPGAAASPGMPVCFKRILCAVDHSPATQHAVRYALDLGRQFRGRVSVLHVLEGIDAEEPCEHVDAGVRTARLRLLDDARGRLRYEVSVKASPQCEVEEIVAPDPHRPYREILRRASEMPADVIVMGAQGAHGIELMFYGSNTHHVVRRAACPVLTVRG